MPPEPVKITDRRTRRSESEGNRPGEKCNPGAKYSLKLRLREISPTHCNKMQLPVFWCRRLTASSGLLAWPEANCCIGCTQNGAAAFRAAKAPACSDEIDSCSCWWSGGGRSRGGLAYSSLLPSMAFSMVISSVYSMSLPTGIPMAMRVTFTPARFNCCER